MSVFSGVLQKREFPHGFREALLSFVGRTSPQRRHVKCVDGSKYFLKVKTKDGNHVGEALGNTTINFKNLELWEGSR